MSWEKIEKLKSDLKNLTIIQEKVDKAISGLKPGKDKDRLMKLKKSNRDHFNKAIIPAWRKVLATLGDPSHVGFGEMEEMGTLPIIPIKAAMLAIATSGNVAKSVFEEQKILNDKAFKPVVVTPKPVVILKPAVVVAPKPLAKAIVPSTAVKAVTPLKASEPPPIVKTPISKPIAKQDSSQEHSFLTTGLISRSK